MTKSLNKETFIKGFKIILKYLKPFQRDILTLALFSVVAAAANAFTPLLAGRLFDSIIALSRNESAAVTAAFNLILIWLAVRLAADIFGWRIDAKKDKVSVLAAAEYVAKGFSRLLQLPMSFHKHKKHGEVTDKINRASNWLERLVDSIFINLAPEFLSIVIALIIAFTINVSLSFVLIAALFVYIFILLRSVPALAVLELKMHRTYNKAYGQAFDVLDNIQEVKQATAESFEKNRLFDYLVKRAAGSWVRISRVWQKLRGWQKILITLTQLSIFAIAVYFVKNGEITPGELVAFNGYAAMFFGPFVILGNNWATIQNGVISIIKAEEILSLPTEIYKPKNAVSLPELKGEIKFEHVLFGYNKKQTVLDDISFSVKSGEVIALVGKSGIGKTTIINLIQGFYSPFAGRITIDGNNIKKLDLLAYRRQIAVVPQEVTLFNDTVFKNILYGAFEKSEEDVKQAAKLSRADEFIESFPKKYKQLVGWRGVKLSTGQKQRIAIARAILRRPKILILDEPTSALDPESEEYIKESLRELMKGKTTFIIAHRLSTVKEADKIIVIEKSKIVESGRHEELIKKPDGIYRRLYELQVGFR